MAQSRRFDSLQGVSFQLPLRQTFATKFSQNGVDIYTIAKLLGHQDINKTQRYAHYCPDSLSGEVEILDVDYNLATWDRKRVFPGTANMS
ncbi:MAG: hypothetical protein D8M57_01515 [Candidatus Scalindua sp. AMX11]|nr:MAG: hypothetical protein DWQ00_15500 [Candidatus Scalindua sp.]NOG85069.1 tyrosine-type recombinase/integrase [Planctomycetota bacterium]RZV93116.1 MAG: hypothetical protein EX341_04430 [Candidatus Scalindua sp. SCAELEC01]TDE66742.1 MAG: hypothetical protein D8M57_01515 [Candidatus Scalindua sp. AMX11]GJQ58053.1 MAG: hypothetical protein SCALA701_08540 [Candidatus Scalindua sp.]